MRSTFVLVCFSLVACHPKPAASPTAAAPSGRIVFTSTRDGHPQIYGVDGDGGHLVRLTHSDSDDDFPLWSPDGAHISFLSNRGGNWDLWIMNADGSQPHKLTDTPHADEHSPAWSPSGDAIAFSSDRDGGDWEVYVVGLDGKNPRNLTKTKGMDFSPNWSPDGKRIAFVSERDGNAELYVMNADGSGQQRLTNDPAFESLGTSAWSPDRSKLVYMAGIDGQIEIMVRDLEGGHPRQLTHHNAPVWKPGKAAPVNVSAGWSPTGSAIIYVTGQLHGTESSSELRIMDPDGSHVRPLLPHGDAYADYAPHWRG
jgi:Tol biopolymer transport system component